MTERELLIEKCDEAIKFAERKTEVCYSPENECKEVNVGSAEDWDKAHVVCLRASLEESK